MLCLTCKCKLDVVRKAAKLVRLFYAEGIVRNVGIEHIVQCYSERRKLRMELLELILDDINLSRAIEKVVNNAGCSGIDKMSVLQGRNYFKDHKEEIKEALRNRTYKPSPIKRVEIPKPDGGKRKLGIPVVVDRIIQQAIAQALTPIYEKQFSDYSYGFRPNRDCHKAINQSLEYINEGYKYVVDIDLEKFFDKVNHDKLMQVLNNTIKDGDVLSIIRKFLVSGVMVNGVLMDTLEGTPQGGPLSPLLSNVILNELDKELEKRKLRFVRYADDCNIYVKSIRAAQRVYESIKNFIEEKLYLKVNESKSKVDIVTNGIKFLGFGFYYSTRHAEIRVRVHNKSIKRIKDKIRTLTSRSYSIDMKSRLLKIRISLIGWINYYKIADMSSLAKMLDQMIRRRLRVCIWKAWKTPQKRLKSMIQLKELFSLNTPIRYIKRMAYTGNRYAHLGQTVLCTVIPNKALEVKGLLSIYEYYTNCSNA